MDTAYQYMMCSIGLFRKEKSVVFLAILLACFHASGLCKSAFGTFDVEMMGLIGAGNNPMVGMTVAVAVAIEEASK